MVKTLTFAAIALAAAFVSPASAQEQLTYGAQQIVNGISDPALQAACAKGGDAIQQLVRGKVIEIKRNRGAIADTDGAMAARVLVSKCHK